jgi:hypothetical protein
MSKTYQNLIQESEVGLAIENILIAPYGTSWTPGKIDISSPPSGFTHLGAVKEDTATLSVTRSKFQLKTGIPQALQFEAVMGLDGKFGIVLYARSSRKLQYALSNVSPTNIGITNHTTITTASATTVQVASIGSLGPNMGVITAATTLGLDTTDSDNVISAFGTGANTLVATMKFAFSTVPTGTLASITGTSLPYGTAILRKFTILGVADFTDGVQVVHFMKKVAASGEMTEEIHAGDVVKVPLQFDLYATTTTSYGGTENVVAERFYYY